MLFNFCLFPFSELISEKLPIENSSPYMQISWNQLTDGWYWIEVGKEHLFRYSQEAWKQLQPPRSTNGLYVDYYVSTFWLDLLDLLPMALEPLPTDLAARLSPIQGWTDWLAAYTAWDEIRSREIEWEKIDVDTIDEDAVVFEQAALKWWYARSLSTSYLISGPRIWFWSDGSYIHVFWDNRDRLLNTVPAWDTQWGEFLLPTSDFLTEVTTFHQHFMEAMAARVKAAPDYWTDSRFTRDLINLPEQQRQKELQLKNALQEASLRTPTNWKLVLDSIASVERDSQFVQILSTLKRS